MTEPLINPAQTVYDRYLRTSKFFMISGTVLSLTLTVMVCFFRLLDLVFFLGFIITFLLLCLGALSLLNGQSFRDRCYQEEDRKMHFLTTALLLPKSRPGE